MLALHRLCKVQPQHGVAGEEATGDGRMSAKDNQLPPAISHRWLALPLIFCDHHRARHVVAGK